MNKINVYRLMCQKELSKKLLWYLCMGNSFKTFNPIIIQDLLHQSKCRFIHFVVVINDKTRNFQ